ncbi:arginine repressor [Desulfitobacterium metallireducens]|uniref:Arginine repressor n=1 Tax=Desulfitobacterium metallireducens DSM 15288 TaxID=871968 RepID=W0EDU1_9FIRM|nr:arginine repressor [Desulfitobacterium metallireducens]AHF07369.1 arginine repressor ArgR [Desulfitobacterium metallireducens DSM 15288]
MKARRQMKIQEIITKEAIHTQEELADHLRLTGFEVTQATVSRDIKEMGLIKIPTPDEDYRYASPGAAQPINSSERLKRRMRETVVTINDSENLIVIRTISGNAQALADLIDKANWEEIIGTVAGDDTILLVIKPLSAVDGVRQRITDIMG